MARTERSRPLRRPLRRRWYLFVVLGALLALAWRGRWTTLAHYLPDEAPELSGEFRTMAEHDELMAGKDWPYVVRVETDGAGSLLYYGSRHTNSPSDPQIAEIQTLWQEHGPTVAVTENRLGLLVGPTGLGVRAFGEFALAYALGRRDGIPVYSLEPTWEVEVEEMKAAFPTEEVTLFYTLRVFLSERGEKTGAELEALAEHLLAKRGGRPGLKGSIPDLEALDRLWNSRFSDLGPWRQLGPHAASPSATPNRLGELANRANEVRDRHAARVLVDLLKRGERVFAIAGGSHVVKQEPVLRASL